MGTAVREALSCLHVPDSIRSAESVTRCETACGCRCDYVDFDVAVFTNILKDKVEAFGGITQYLDAQGSLFMKLQDEHRQRAVVNTDGAPSNKHCKSIAEKHFHGHTHTNSLDIY